MRSRCNRVSTSNMLCKLLVLNCNAPIWFTICAFHMQAKIRQSGVMFYADNRWFEFFDPGMLLAYLIDSCNLAAITELTTLDWLVFNEITATYALLDARCLFQCII